MPNTIALKQRINSVKNTRQITKAQELVSASKMRRAQELAKLSRDYRRVAYAILARLSSIKEVESHPLFEKRKIKTKLYIVITSNTGLAGAYNSNVLKLLTKSVIDDRDKGIKSQVITIGKKAANYARHLEHISLLAVYPAFGNQPTANDIRPILNTLLDSYRNKEIDSAEVIYTEFVSNLVQKAKSLDLLPAHLEENSEDAIKYKNSFTNFEPSVEEVLDGAASRLVEVQIWQALLESLASEHSMRMLAMKNATDNANDLIDDYTLEFNTARQASITQELAEISGGVAALTD
jgi:F-type H+-transporting ATPase subunit gamma